MDFSRGFEPEIRFNATAGIKIFDWKNCSVGCLFGGLIDFLFARFDGRLGNLHSSIYQLILNTVLIRG